MTQENGHLSCDEPAVIKNGISSDDAIADPAPAATPPQSSVQSNRVNSPTNVSRPLANHRAGSPTNYTGTNAHGAREEASPPMGSQNSPPNHQHVVHVHVNPGETFSVRLGDQIQHIQGKLFFCFFNIGSFV